MVVLKQTLVPCLVPVRLLHMGLLLDETLLVCQTVRLSSLGLGALEEVEDEDDDHLAEQQIHVLAQPLDPHG